MTTLKTICARYTDRINESLKGMSFQLVLLYTSVPHTEAIAALLSVHPGCA